MAGRKFLLCNAALLLCLAIVNFQQAEAQCGGFCASCTSITMLSNGILQASCSNGSGTNTAQIGLDAYIGNSDGNLVEGSGFLGSCYNLNTLPLPTGEVLLQADCKNQRGTAQLTWYHINSNVANDHGGLNWHKC